MTKICKGLDEKDMTKKVQQFAFWPGWGWGQGIAPTPPNRTGGFPASGSPVSGFSFEREYSSSYGPQVRRSDVRNHPTQLHSTDSTTGYPSRALALVLFSVFLALLFIRIYLR